MHNLSYFKLVYEMDTPEPIMLAYYAFEHCSKIPMLYSNYAQLCPILLQICSFKLCLDCCIRVSTTSVDVLLGYFYICSDCSVRVHQSLTIAFPLQVAVNLIFTVLHTIPT